MMSAAVAPVGSSPTKVAWLIRVWFDTMKSSAVSVSTCPALGRRDKVPINPSGLPVLKKNGAATAGPTITKPTTPRVAASFFIANLPCRISGL